MVVELPDGEQLTLLIRDGMFAERAGLEAWEPADTAVRAQSYRVIHTFAEDLAREGLRLHPTLYASAAQAMAASGEVLVTSAGLAAIAGALRAWVRRHDGKKVHIEYNGRHIDITGMATDDVERLLASITNLTSSAEDDEPEPN